MLHDFDVRSFFVDAETMLVFEEEAEYAADQLNGMLLHAYEVMQESPDFWNYEQAYQFISEFSEAWLTEPALTEADLEELFEYIRHLIQGVEQEQDVE